MGGGYGVYEDVRMKKVVLGDVGGEKKMEGFGEVGCEVKSGRKWVEKVEEMRMEELVRKVLGKGDWVEVVVEKCEIGKVMWVMGGGRGGGGKVLKWKKGLRW